MSMQSYFLSGLQTSLLLAGTFLVIDSTRAQNFLPSTSLGGAATPPAAFDIINDNPAGNVGIGIFPSRPNPTEKLTVGGNISLYPDMNQVPTFERKISAHDAMGLIGIYSKDFDHCQGAGIRLHAEGMGAQNSGMVDLFSTGVSITGGQLPAFQFTTYEPCNPFRRMVITRNGLAGFGDDIDGTLLHTDDRLSIDNSLALISVNDATDRYIRARSVTHSLNLMAGADPNDGAGIQLFGRNDLGNSPGTNLSPYTPSGITFTAYDFRPNNVQNAVAYKFMHRHYGGGAFHSFSIDQLGNARFGPNIPASERLTVDGDIYLAGPSRKIVGRTGSGTVEVCSGTTAADGGRIALTTSGGGSTGQVTLNALAPNGTTRGFTFNGKAGSAGAADVLGIDINGQTHFSADLDFSLANSSAHNIKGLHTSLNLYSKTNATDGSAIELSTNAQRFSVAYTGTAQTSLYKFERQNGSTINTLMNVYSDGRVTIGSITAPPATSDYRLYVEKGIQTERVNVAIHGTSAWNDAVFESDYVLRPLAEVASYTAAHRHLPEIPSAEEVVRDGIDVAKMDALLLKKIEELTLYAIQQQKTIEAQAADLATLKKQVAALTGK